MTDKGARCLRPVIVHLKKSIEKHSDHGNTRRGKRKREKNEEEMMRREKKTTSV